MKPLIVLCGPTGVGKSELAMALAEKLDGEIVSADAGQVYRGFDIGTAKPSIEERARIPHHCIDLWDPDFQSDAIVWARAADRAVADMTARGKQPIVVGGTTFYIRALLHGLFEGPDPDPDLRMRLRREFEEKGGEVMHQRLKSVDPKAAARIHPNDPVRLVRALEVFFQTGKPISEHQEEHHFSEKRYSYIKVGLSRGRPDLYRRIDERAQQMVASGWIEEVRSLLERWGGDVPAFQLIGYRTIRDYLDGQLQESELVTTIQQLSRNYSKRQLTWLRGDSEIQWFDARVVRLTNIYELFD